MSKQFYTSTEAAALIGLAPFAVPLAPAYFLAHAVARAAAEPMIVQTIIVAALISPSHSACIAT